MATEASAMSDLTNVWRAVSGWPPEQRRALATRLLQSLEQDEGPIGVAARLDQIRGLADGWLDGKGLAPSSKGLDWLAGAFDRNFPDDLPAPFLYPTAEGGVQAEWTLYEHEVSLEVDLTDHSAEWQAVNLTTQEEQDRRLNLDEADDWNWIANQIRNLTIDQS